MKAFWEASPWRRLDVSIAVGVLLGCVYTAVDVYFDHVIDVALQASASPTEIFHGVIDLVLPAGAGALLGAVLHFTQRGAQTAAFEKQRADDLAARLHRIERDQAVWVISASLLHELKTPLHALGLLLDEINDLPDDASDDRKALLERARVQNERLADRLYSLRSLPNARPTELPAVELSSCVSGLVEPLARLAERQGVKLHFSGAPVMARVQPTYLRIVLENLVENALTALEQRSGEGHVSVQVSAEAERAVISVADDGPGLGEELTKRAFEPLFTKRATGLGLGLSIARSLCRSMDGDLVLVDTERGATFQVQLEKEAA